MEKGTFFLCKHLVKTLTCPAYKEVSIYRQAPYVVIDLNTTGNRANIEDEERDNIIGMELDNSSHKYSALSQVFKLTSMITSQMGIYRPNKIRELRIMRCYSFSYHM